MEPYKHERVKSIFLRAAELTGAEREAVLAAECGEDEALRRRVEFLLACNEETGTMDDILPPGETETLAPTLAGGRLVSGRFRVRRLIGKGGMGEVYEATDEELGGVVALKIILPGLFTDEKMARRFRREAHLARQVTHPNICRIFDVGREQEGAQDLLYLTMEYIDGETLTACLRKRGRFPVAEAVGILRQIAAGLEALHEKKIVHRDLKPSNVMLVRNANGGTRAVIGDFGLARAVLEESVGDSLSRSGFVMGTPAYMAPEQRAGRKISPATDVYSFGLLAYELLTGKRAQPINSGQARPAARGGDIPAAWERVIRQCLEEEPARRPPTAMKVVEALEERSRPRRWWVRGGLAAMLAVATPLVWRSKAGPVEEALGALEHAYRPRAAERALQLVENEAPEVEVLRVRGLAYLELFERTGKGEWLALAREAADAGAGPLVRGRILLVEGKLEQAEALLGSGEDVAGLLALATLTERRGRAAESEKHLRAVLGKAPEHARALGRLGALRLEAGDFTEAKRLLRRATELNEGDWESWGNLGVASVWGGEDERKAMAAFARAVEVAEKSPSDVHRLARVGGFHAYMGNREKGVASLRRAAALDGEQAETAYRIGEAYEVLRERGEAVRWIRLALQRGYRAEAVKQNPALAELRRDARVQAR